MPAGRSAWQSARDISLGSAPLPVNVPNATSGSGQQWGIRCSIARRGATARRPQVFVPRLWPAAHRRTAEGSMPKTQKPRRPAPPAKKGKRPSPVTAAELLLEIGVEELPHQFIAPALAVLKDSAEQMLKDQRLLFQSARTLGTPRRLTLVVEGLATQQTAMVKEAMGPSEAVAFDQAGQQTGAATGCASGQGVAVQDLEIRRTPKGEYLFAVKQEQGRPANVVLKPLLLQ